jgi:hypothetical protein
LPATPDEDAPLPRPARLKPWPPVSPLPQSPPAAPQRVPNAEDILADQKAQILLFLTTLGRPIPTNDAEDASALAAFSNLVGASSDDIATLNDHRLKAEDIIEEFRTRSSRPPWWRRVTVGARDGPADNEHLLLPRTAPPLAILLLNDPLIRPHFRQLVMQALDSSRPPTDTQVLTTTISIRSYRDRACPVLDITVRRSGWVSELPLTRYCRHGGRGWYVVSYQKTG